MKESLKDVLQFESTSSVLKLLDSVGFFLSNANPEVNSLIQNFDKKLDSFTKFDQENQAKLRILVLGLLSILKFTCKLVSIQNKSLSNLVCYLIYSCVDRTQRMLNQTITNYPIWYFLSWVNYCKDSIGWAKKWMLERSPMLL